MSPRRGGESDKLGNRYEAAWTIMHLLYVLQGRGHSLRVEDTGDLAEGSEFTYRDAGSIQVHQLKRQNGLINNWSVKSLRTFGIWAKAKKHVKAGRQYHFVSTVPARVLQELAEQARQAENLEQYIKEFIAANKILPPVFDELAAAGVLDDSYTAFRTLKGTYLSVYGEREINSINEVIAETILEGGNGKSIAADLASLILNNLGVTLTRETTIAGLAEYGIQPADSSALPSLLEQVEAINRSWADSIARQLIQPVLPRSEADELAELILADGKLTLMTGEAGGGKTGVLYQSVSKLQADGLATLCFRLDRLDHFSSSSELGVQLGLGRSPVAALAVAAGNAPSVLVVDQLDAVSFASGRMPDSLDSVADLVREADAFPLMRTVWVCRQFDVDNDERIRTLVEQWTAKTLRISLLTDSQVNEAVDAMGIDAAQLRPEQRQLLQTPFNLSLLNAVADDATVLAFDGVNRLLEAYWNRKRRDAHQRRPGTRFDQVVRTIAEAMSSRQTLSVPDFVLDPDGLANDADVLVSEYILTRDGNRLAFAHEAMFDYAFARAWMTHGVSLIMFFASDTQELFRRGQLRQILTFMRSVEPERFVAEIEALLTSEDIRFHLKDATLGVLGGLSDPTALEAAAVLRIADAVEFRGRLWRRLATPAWFVRFDEQGYIRQWIRSDSDLKQVAIDLIAQAAKVEPDRVASILEECDLGPDNLRHVFRFVDVSENERIFQLLLRYVSEGLYVGFERWLWIGVHSLPEQDPDRAVRLLQTFLQQPHALRIAGDGKVALLELKEYTLGEYVRECAKLSPLSYCAAIIPYLISVMDLTRVHLDGFGYDRDEHFGQREREHVQGGELDAALMIGAVDALEELARTEPGIAEPFLYELATVESDAAQYLLYRGLIASGQRHAEWAAQLLLADVRRLFCGWRSDSVWITRLLLQEISAHIESDQFTQIEDTVRDLRYPWEQRRGGWYAFTLLSGLEESRLSELGRRRLREYRRKFNAEQPPEPEGVIGGFIGSPIPAGSASKMRDKNWLSAIRKHSTDQSNWNSFTGGARELSQPLREQTKQDPARFAALAMSFDETTHPSYGVAVLTGLGEAETLSDPTPVFDAIRHLAAIPHEDHDRWLGWALRPYMVSAPMDIVELVRDHALSATDPTDDGLQFTSDRDELGRSSNLELSAMNTTRGSLVEALGDLLIADSDGSRTSAVVPVLERFSADPSVAVRVSSAHLVATVLRWDRPAALRQLPVLFNTNDLIFTASSAQLLLSYVGNQDFVPVLPLLDRMLASDQAQVRRVGGQLAAFAAIEWVTNGEQLEQTLQASDSSARRGAAELCAHHLHRTNSVLKARRVLESLASDQDLKVREAVGAVAMALRGEPIRPFADTLRFLLESPAYEFLMPQMLYTLDSAPDKVDDLVILIAKRFVEVFGVDSADIHTRAAGDTSHIGRLVIRALAQSTDARERSDLLDVLDNLLLVGSYGIEDLIAKSERGHGFDDAK